MESRNESVYAFVLWVLLDFGFLLLVLGGVVFFVGLRFLIFGLRSDFFHWMIWFGLVGWWLMSF